MPALMPTPALATVAALPTTPAEAALPAVPTTAALLATAAPPTTALLVVNCWFHAYVLPGERRTGGTSR